MCGYFTKLSPSSSGFIINIPFQEAFAKRRHSAGVGGNGKEKWRASVFVVIKTERRSTTKSNERCTYGE